MVLSLRCVVNQATSLSSLALLRKISSTLNASGGLGESLQTVIEELALKLDLAGCMVLTVDQPGQYAIVQAYYDRYIRSKEHGEAQLPLERYPVLVEAVRTTMIQEDRSLSVHLWEQAQPSSDRAADRCFSLIVPLVSAHQVIGLLLCQSAHPEIRFTEEERLVLETAAELITNALESAKSQLREDALSMLAHDLRSPILMVVQLLGLSTQGIYGPLTSEQQQVFSELGDNCDLLLGLINDMLDVCNYEAGTLVLGRTVIDVPKIIHQSVRLLQHAAADKGVCLETHFGPNVASLVADEKRIMRVLINLLDNAIRFSPPGEKVVLSCHRLVTDEVRISVTDVGPGIPKENQQKIFDKFYQAWMMKAYSPIGVGLGLAFCRKTVQAHGGKIWVKSPVNDHGGGSRFCFTLPPAAISQEGIGWHKLREGQ